MISRFALLVCLGSLVPASANAADTTVPISVCSDGLASCRPLEPGGWQKLGFTASHAEIQFFRPRAYGGGPIRFMPGAKIPAGVNVNVRFTTFGPANTAQGIVGDDGSVRWDGFSLLALNNKSAATSYGPGGAGVKIDDRAVVAIICPSEVAIQKAPRDQHLADSLLGVMKVMQIPKDSPFASCKMFTYALAARDTTAPEVIDYRP